MDKVTKDANKPAEPKPETKPSGAAEAQDSTSGSTVRWNNINSDLKSALDTWDVLTDQLANKLSPEEEQLREIKNILGTLKDKLNEFDDDK